MKLKIFSFFSGAGFLDLGFEAAGFELVFANEINKDFAYVNSYSRSKLNYPPLKYGLVQEDVREFLYNEKRQKELRSFIESEEKENGSLIGFIGGPPCPDFSVAGKNRGSEGKHGVLSQVYIDLICKYTPDFFFFENVKGLWKTKKHREFFDSITQQAEKAGYKLVYQLMNSLQYKAPQDRDRIFLIGVKEEVLENMGLNISDFDWKTQNSLDEIKSLPWPKTNGVERKITQPPSNIDVKLTVQYWFNKNKVEDHPNSKDFFQPRAILRKIPFIEEGDVSRKSLKRLHRWRYSPTVAYGNNEVHLHPYLNRRISVSEALSLQSLPKEFELPHDLSLTAKFKTIGNGVPYLMAKGVGSALFSFLQGKKNESD